MDFKGYLMVIDMDGTFLDSKRKISPENRRALEQWRALGGEVCIASGRSAAGLVWIQRKLGLTLPLICGNGSGIYDCDREELIYNITLPEGGRELAEAADRLLPETGITIYKDAKVYFCKENAATIRNMTNERLPHLTADWRTLPYPWEKILFSQEAKCTGAVQELMERVADRRVFRLLKSAPVYYEVLNPLASKGQALGEYCARLGFELSKVVAVGDNENDVSMLEIAGFPFTVANCTPPARDAARWVVSDNDHSCVADVVRIMKDRLGD